MAESPVLSPNLTNNNNLVEKENVEAETVTHSDSLREDWAEKRDKDGQAEDRDKDEQSLSPGGLTTTWRKGIVRRSSLCDGLSDFHLATSYSYIDKNESHTTVKKRVLYLYLAFTALVWYDIGTYFFGLGGSIMASFINLYIFILCYPGQVLGWDLNERLQIRSILLCYITMFNGYFAVSLWFIVVADARYSEWLLGLLIENKTDRFQLKVKYTAPFRTLLMLYVVWINTFDKYASSGRMDRFIPSMRKRKFYKHMASYFPVSLTKTADLPPENGPYVFGYHPHGFLSVGAFINFATDATNFSELFPGIDVRILTLRMNFFVPFLREFLVAIGACDVSRPTIENLLQTNRSVILVPGGAAESLITNIGSNQLILSSRKGFVKAALQNGATLVPVYSFGETDLYAIHTLGPFGQKVQNFLQKILGFAIPLVYGRSLTGGLARKLFGFKKGIFPLRTPVFTVVGRPIPCPTPETLKKLKLPAGSVKHVNTKDSKNANTNDKPKVKYELSNEVIEKYHNMYIEQLKELHSDWAPIYEYQKQKRLAELEGHPLRGEVLKEEAEVYGKLRLRAKSLYIR